MDHTDSDRIFEEHGMIDEFGMLYYETLSSTAKDDIGPPTQ
jgi:hypothetical protein